MAQSNGGSLRFVTLASEIVSAYVSHNHVQSADLPGLLNEVHAAIRGICDAGQSQPIAKATAQEIRRSINPDFLISFEDGKPYKTLRRHLATHGLTPEEYRERYGLKPDYPMVAESYSESRRAMAKKIGLGRKPGPRNTTTNAPAARKTRKADAADAE